MNTRFFNAKILVPAEGHRFEVTEGELWVQGDTICYIGYGSRGGIVRIAGRMSGGSFGTVRCR